MRLGWRTLGVATLLIPAMFTIGCGGVNATGSVSPLMFLMPGLGQTGPAPVEAPAAPCPADLSQDPIQIAVHTR
jgi:hypothetical protein